MATIEVDLKAAGALFRRMGDRVPGIVRRGLLSAALQAQTILVRATDTAPPASANGSRGAFNYGDYRRAWKARPDTRAGSQGLLVSNDRPYAGVIEYGRRAGARRPPSEPIARWAQRKLGLPYARAKGIAFVIAKRIGERGLRPRRVLTSRTTTSLLIEAMRRDVLRELLRSVESA